MPKDIKSIRTFLGLCGYYRRFIPNFALISKPLNDLLKKDIKFKWNSFCDESFSTFKTLLTNPPILQYPNFDFPFVLTTDASGEAL